MQYLHGWFALDVFTCIPFDLIFSGVASAANVEVNAQMFRLLRMLRLMKLMRIMRASRIIGRWQDHVGLSFAFLSLIKFTFLTGVLAHWLACLWGFVGASGDTLDDEETTWTGYGNDKVTWRQKHKIGVEGAPADPFAIYGVALYVALNNVFGGSCEINAANYVEFYVQSVMLVIGSTLWAYIIGSACGIIATLDPARLEFRQTLDELNYFVHDMNVPADLTVKLRQYFRNTMYLVRVRRYEALLSKMSTRLRGDTAYEMCRSRLRKVHYLVDPQVEPEFMCSLAIKYTTSVYSRLERVACTSLFVVERGVVAKRGRLGLAGACFGEDVILSNDDLRDVGDAIALTFVQAISLTQTDIFELLPDFPRAYHVVRRAALRIALVRALVKAAQIVRRAGFNSRGLTIADIFDKAMRESAQARADEVERSKPVKVANIPLTLKEHDLDERTSQLLNSMKRKMLKPQGGGTSWSKLSRQKTTYQKASAANEKAEAAKQEAARRSALASAFKKTVRPPNFGQDLPKAAITTEEQLRHLSSEVARNYATLVESTAKLLEGHSQLNDRIAKLETANAAVLAKLEEGLASRSMRRRNVRQNTGSQQAITAASNASSAAMATVSQPPASRSCVSAVEHRAELREEGSQPMSRSSPFDA